MLIQMLFVYLYLFIGCLFIHFTVNLQYVETESDFTVDKQPGHLSWCFLLTKCPQGQRSSLPAFPEWWHT